MLQTWLGDLIREEMRSRGTAAITVTHGDRINSHAERTVQIATAGLPPGPTL